MVAVNGANNFLLNCLLDSCDQKRKIVGCCCDCSFSHPVSRRMQPNSFVVLYLSTILASQVKTCLHTVLISLLVWADDADQVKAKRCHSKVSDSSKWGDKPF